MRCIKSDCEQTSVKEAGAHVDKNSLKPKQTREIIYMIDNILEYNKQLTIHII